MTERATDDAGRVGSRRGTDVNEEGRGGPTSEPFEALSDLLADVPDDLRVAADAAVRDADGVEALRADLEALLAGRDAAGETDDPDAVSGADSIADLRGALDERVPDDRDRLPEVDAATATERASETAERARTAGNGAVDRLKSGVGGLRERVAGPGGDGSTGGDEPPADRAADGIDPDGDAGGRGTEEVASTTDGDATDAPLPIPDRTATRRSVARIRSRAGAGVADLKYTLGNADPKQAAIWGLATGATLANPAIAAGYSTAVLLSGAVLGGSAVGAYASSHEGTVLDELDPVEMARNANGMAAANRGRSNLNGAAMGSLLGATAYVAGRVTPEEYAHWLADVDLDTVARGAELGAGAARDRADLGLGSAASGALFGGGLGAAYGVATEDGDDDLRELLDADIYDDYRRTLADESDEEEV